MEKMNLHRKTNRLEARGCKIMLGVMIMFMVISMVSALDFDNIIENKNNAETIEIAMNIIITPTIIFAVWLSIKEFFLCFSIILQIYQVLLLQIHLRLK